MDTNSQRGAAVTTGAMRTDVRHKISKLEADSRRLCLNLRNLEKNRAKLTNEAVALVQELENPMLGCGESEDAVYGDSADCIRVLLDAKHFRQNECCTICTCSECDDRSETAGDVEEKDLAESPTQTIISPAEPEERDRCCDCRKDNATDSGYTDGTAATVGAEVVGNLKSGGSEEKVNFCPTCSETRSCDYRCEICRCELDNRETPVTEDNFPAKIKGEERCRGGMDRVGSMFWPLTIFGETRDETNKKMCEGCECNLCDIRNDDGELPPCVTTCRSSGISNDEDTIDELISSGDAPAKLQQICKVEKLREVLEQLKNRNHALRKMLNDCDCLHQSTVDSLAPEKRRKIRDESPESGRPVARSTSGLIATVKHLQDKCRTKDGMILALAEALKKLASPDQTDRILTRLSNPCSDESPVRDMDRSELWKYLRMENCEKQPDVSVEGKARTRGNFRMLLLTLFVVILSQYFFIYGSHPATFRLFDFFAKLFAGLEEFSYRTAADFSKHLASFATVINDFSQEFSTEIMRKFTEVSDFFLVYANFFSSHLAYLGALFGSLSFARTVWSLGKHIAIRDRLSRDFIFSPRLREFFGPVKILAARTVCHAKSQYHFFSYLSCLALGFVAGKVTRVVDKWPAFVSNIYDANLSVE